MGKDQGGVFVYRLAQLEEASTAPGREEMKEHVLEGSRGCSLYSLGDREHSSLTLAVGLARKIIVYKWKHAEEWMTFTDDTVQGFELLTEIHCVEAPQDGNLAQCELQPVDNIPPYLTCCTHPSPTMSPSPSLNLSL